jgi:hypothetical protein
MAASGEHSTKPSGSIKDGKFLDKLSDCYRLQEDTVLLHAVIFSSVPCAPISSPLICQDHFLLLVLIPVNYVHLCGPTKLTGGSP